MIKIKRCLCLFLCFLSLLPSATCWGAESSAESKEVVTIPKSEWIRLKGNLNQLDRTFELLSQTSSQSVKDLLQAEKKLAEYEQRLAKQEQLLLQYENELKQMQQLLLKQDESLVTANKLLMKLSDDTKKEILRLKAEKVVWEGVAGVAIGAAAYMFFKK